MPKRLNEDQMQRVMKAALLYFGGEGPNSTYKSLTETSKEILDELDSTEEEPADDIGRTSVEERAEMFFSEITARLVTGLGDDALPTIQDRYRYIARRSLELEADAVRRAVKDRNELQNENYLLEEERDDAFRRADEWEALVKKLEAERDELKAKALNRRDKIVEVYGVLGSEVDILERKVKELTKKRDELKAELANKDRALRAQDRIIEAADRERDELVAQVDRLMDADVNQYNILIAENSDLKAEVKELTKERDDLTKKLSVKESALEYRRNEVSSIEKDYDELKTEKSDLENQLKNAKNELAGWKVDFSDFTALRERRMTFEEKERLVEKASMELARERDELKAKLDSIEKLAKAHSLPLKAERKELCQR